MGSTELNVRSETANSQGRPDFPKIDHLKINDFPTLTLEVTLKEQHASCNFTTGRPADQYEQK